MAVIPSFKRLVKEDFQKEYQPLIEKVGYTTNSAFESIFNALNGGLNFDNLSLPYKEVNLQVSASGAPLQTTQFKTGFSSGKKLKGLQVIKVENLTDTTALLTGAPFVTYTENNDLITITQVTGLVANNKYTLRILVLG